MRLSPLMTAYPRTGTSRLPRYSCFFGSRIQSVHLVSSAMLKKCFFELPIPEQFGNRLQLSGSGTCYRVLHS